MTRRSKDIGTAAETAVVRYLRINGFPHAERRALHGTTDLGDITGIPGVVIEVKGGEAAKTASDGQIDAWLVETETERVNARADIGLLVVQRKGIGPANAGRWWAIAPWSTLVALHEGRRLVVAGHLPPVRVHLAHAAGMLRLAGYGADCEAAS